MKSYLKTERENALWARKPIHRGYESGKVSPLGWDSSLVWWSFEMTKLIASSLELTKLACMAKL